MMMHDIKQLIHEVGKFSAMIEEFKEMGVTLERIEQLLIQIERNTNGD